MRDLDDSIAWTEGGDNALTGTHDGKQAVGELWGKLIGEGFRTLPHHFVAEGDKVVVLTTRRRTPSVKAESRSLAACGSYPGCTGDRGDSSTVSEKTSGRA
jgi:hypothetical protein